MCAFAVDHSKRESAGNPLPISRVISLLAFVLLATALLGQTFRARVQGLVTDESKAAIAGASVTLLNVNTGGKVTRSTSETGLYVFDNVDPGTYSVAVEMAGFRKFTQENVVVQSGGDVTVNVAMKVGSVQSERGVRRSRCRSIRELGHRGRRQPRAPRRSPCRGRRRTHV